MDMRFSLYNIVKTMNMGIGQYLINSLVIAFGVSIIGTLFAYIIAYFTARTPGKSSKTLHLISITSLAIPGLVLGLSYVIFFNSSFIYGTMAILILVNIVHFLASPYLMAYNSLGKLNRNLEDVGLTLGIERLYIIKDILVPQTGSTIIEMFSYFFVNSMITISAVSFLSSVHNSPISLMINQFEAQMLLESTAFVSLLILSCNFILKSLAYFAKRYMKKKES
jgi:iron(III) transport system permease protein